MILKELISKCPPWKGAMGNESTCFIVNVFLGLHINHPGPRAWISHPVTKYIVCANLSYSLMGPRGSMPAMTN
jgi:hypothetical protein